MKKILLFIAIAMFLITGCKKNNITESEVSVIQDENTIRRTFNFSPYNIEPIRDVNPIGDYCTRFDVYVYKGTDTINPVIRIHQVKDNNNNGFGSISLDLKLNEQYTMYAIAHKCSDTAYVDNSVIRFPDEKVTHSFFYKDKFTITSLTEAIAPVECVMHRIIGCFSLYVLDAKPDEVTKFRFTIDSTGTRWHVNNHAENIIERIHFINISTVNPNGSFFCNVFIIADVMDEIKYMDINVEALTSNDEVYESRFFENVPIQNEWRTTYQGTFFISFNMNYTFTANDWNNFDPIIYLIY